MVGTRLVVSCALLAGLFFVGGCARPAPQADSAYEDAVAAAAADGRLVIASFTADWCAPCKRMEATTWTDGELLAWVDRHAVRVLVDIDRRPDLARLHGVRSIPTAAVFDETTELGRFVGMRDAPGMIEWLEGLRARRVGSSGTDGASVGDALGG